MSKVIFSLFASLFIAAPVAAIENGDTVYVDYDLQGGVNNPDNIAFYIYDASNREQNPLLPPTKLPRKGPIFWAGTRRHPLLLPTITRRILFTHTKSQIRETS